MRRALAVEFFICFPLSPSSAGLSHHPHPTERPSSDNSRILVILDWSDKKRAFSRRRWRRDNEGQMAREKMAKGKRQRTESTTKIIAERNEESDGAEERRKVGRSSGMADGGCFPASSTSHSPAGGSDDRDRRQKGG